MVALSQAELVRVWELGQAHSPWLRMILLLEAGFPELSHDELAALTISELDSRLLALRRLVFGPRLEAVCECPRCRRTLELHLDTSQLSADRGARCGSMSTVHCIESDPYRIEFRLPTVGDLRAVAGLESEAGASILFDRCIRSAERSGNPVRAADLPPAARWAVETAMLSADPASELDLELICDDCGLRTNAAFDIAEFFWREIQACAPQILDEVHLLASRYGWSEADILAMSPVRRQHYLQMGQA